MTRSNKGKSVWRKSETPFAELTLSGLKLGIHEMKQEWCSVRCHVFFLNAICTMRLMCPYKNSLIHCLTIIEGTVYVNVNQWDAVCIYFILFWPLSLYQWISMEYYAHNLYVHFQTMLDICLIWKATNQELIKFKNRSKLLIVSLPSPSILTPSKSIWGNLQFSKALALRGWTTTWEMHWSNGLVQQSENNSKI